VLGLPREADPETPEVYLLIREIQVEWSLLGPPVGEVRFAHLTETEDARDALFHLRWDDLVSRLRPRRDGVPLPVDHLHVDDGAPAQLLRGIGW
jgi:hypothetical protein